MNSLPLRVVLLAMLLFALNAWAVRHLGSSLKELAALNGFTAFVALVMGWIEQRDADAWRSRLRAALGHATRAPVLASLYLLAIAGTSLVSSVTVLADGTPGATTVRLFDDAGEGNASVAGERLAGPAGSVRFVRLTSPFGRRYRLEASGFQPRSLVLEPWTGSTLSLATDLVRLPSVLLRIPPSLHSLLPGSRVVIASDGWQAPLEVGLAPGRAALQLGTPAAIPDAWRQDWQSELRTMHDVPDALREAFYRNWLNPLRDGDAPSLLPGQSLDVSMVTAAGASVLEQQVIVSRDPLQDVALLAGSAP